jgi:SAM-dependent methyltransferase
MPWLAKAVLQKGLSALPRAERANYLFRRHVTHTVPSSEHRFRRKFKRALVHLDAYDRHGPGRPPADAVFYEFGAGWDLTIPLSYWALGVHGQVVVDIRRNLRPELVALTLDRLRRLAPELEANAGRPLRVPGPADGTSDLARTFGIEYLAPCDARSTGLASASMDFVTSTNTLEHVPAEDILPLLAECRRILSPEGAISCRIDLRDHFANFDDDLSPYNFLRYSDRAWRLVNSSLGYQNRLRRPDYLRLFAAAGLTVVSEQSATPGPAKLDELRRLALAARFRAYRLEDVAVTRLDVVAIPADRLPDASQQVRDLDR